MKKLKLTAMLILVSGYATYAQKTSAPKNVQDAFNKKFPTAKEVKWDKENESEWEAEFTMDGHEYSANFTTDGKWKETEHSVSSSDIPFNVKKTLTSEFSGYDIEESEISETKDGLIYEFTIEKEEHNLEIGIDKGGNVTKKKEKKEKKENEKEDEED